MGKEVRRTKSDKAYDRLKGIILAGRLEDGQRLSEAAAAKMVGTGRGPVRDAILRLESEGLLKSKGQRKSRTVAFAEDEDLAEMLARYELRKYVEGGAARLAAMNMNGWQVNRLRALLEEVRQSQDYDQLFDAGTTFQEYLIANCGNHLMLRVWERERLRSLRLRSPEPVVADLQVVIDAYGPIVDGIAARDPDAAEQATRGLVQMLVDYLRDVLMHGPPAPTPQTPDADGAPPHDAP